MDDCWMENVGPLITALEELGADPVEWAGDPDFSIFHKDDSQFPAAQDEGLMAKANFACGYMLATSNLTGRTMAEQMAEELKREEEWNRPKLGDCPKCGKYNMQRERRLDGFTTCMSCGYKARNRDWDRESEEKYGEKAQATDKG